jgi:hypothetical protein
LFHRYLFLLFLVCQVSSVSFFDNVQIQKLFKFEIAQNQISSKLKNVQISKTFQIRKNVQIQKLFRFEKLFKFEKNLDSKIVQI